jgi:hypothetical protein
MRSFRRLVTRWEYHIECLLGIVHLACLHILPRSSEEQPTSNRNQSVKVPISDGLASRMPRKPGQVTGKKFDPSPIEYINSSPLER